MIYSMNDDNNSWDVMNDGIDTWDFCGAFSRWGRKGFYGD